MQNLISKLTNKPNELSADIKNRNDFTIFVTNHIIHKLQR